MADTDPQSGPLNTALHTRRQVYLHLLALVIIAVGLSVLTYSLHGVSHQGSSDFHAVIEMVGAVLGITAATVIFGQILALGNRFHLMVGLSFLLSGVQDMVHGMLEYGGHHHWFVIAPDTLAHVIMTTGVSSRILTAGTLVLAFCLPQTLVPVEQRKACVMRTVLYGLLASALITFVNLYVLPRGSYRHSTLLGARPIDVVCGIGFLSAMVGLLYRYWRTRRILGWWMGLSIMLQLHAQVTIAFVSSHYDTLYDLAHVYRFFSYVVPLMGFLLFLVCLITDYERTGEELRRSREAAESANRAKSAFLANMSHEIRTPMTAILGFTDLLADPFLSPQESQEYIDAVRRNGRHLLTLINDILDLSRIEVGRMDLEWIDCDLHTLISDVLVPLQCRARQKGLSLSVNYYPGVPATIRTDPTRLSQILINLIGNAVKFTQSGTVCVTIRPSSDKTSGDPHLIIDVTDSGIGMTPEQIAILFRPFVQADASMTRRFGGSGLGLAISQRLAQMLGGGITVSSQPNQGSTFTLTVNATLATAPTPAQSQLAAPAPSTQTPASLAGRRILLAEDGIDNQRLIGLHLKRAGAIVQVAENGQIAADMVLKADPSQPSFDLILMDMQMPILDGYQATAFLRNAGCQIPIIALTAHAMDTDRARCLAAGCTDYLTKPIDRTLLISTIHLHLVPKAQAA